MITNNDIRRMLGAPVVSREFEIKQVDALGVNFNTLMFINNPNADITNLDDSNGCVYLMNSDYYGDFYSDDNDFIRVSNPKFRFCKIVEQFKLRSKLQNTYQASDKSGSYMNHYHMRMSFSHALYCDEFYIGERCQFDPGVIIGGTDFSPVMGDDRSTLVQFPQMGGVKIGNDVVVKYNTMIGKGTFGYTEIGDNTMIDYGCQIGHNCIIGKSCIIAAGSIIGGSTVVGDNVTIGIGARIRNSITIGDNASIGMGAVVTKDVPPDTVVVGNPARIIAHKPIFDQGGLV